MNGLFEITKNKSEKKVEILFLRFVLELTITSSQRLVDNEADIKLIFCLC